MKVLPLIGRTSELFESDLIVLERKIRSIIIGSRFLVIGAAGSIGQAIKRTV